MQFYYAYILYFIPVIALLLYYVLFFKRKTYSILYPIHSRGMEKYSEMSYAKYIPALFKILAIIFIMIALARPRILSEFFKNNAKGIDIMIAFDVSDSMLIEDYNDGKNRIGIAKETVKEFINGRIDDRIGFLIFSGESMTLCSPTLDYQVLTSFVDEASTNTLKRGTAIGDAIASSVNRLKNSIAKSKVIILLTDGDNNMGSISPVTAGSLAKQYNVKVYSIAFGRDGLVRLPVFSNIRGRRIKTYQNVNSSINPKLLQRISAETGGKFFRARKKDTLKRVFENINELEPVDFDSKRKIHSIEIFQRFLLIGIILLITEYILSRTRLRVLPE